MIDFNTTTVTCDENRLIFRVEYALRNEAKREQDFGRAVWMGQCALVTQKERFAHEEECEVCRAAEAIN